MKTLFTRLFSGRQTASASCGKKKPFWSSVPDKPVEEPVPYDKDGLKSMHNHEFETDSYFVEAYTRGVKAVGEDYHWHWRVHLGLWAAYTASRLDGDFVECGVNKGFMSSAIMQFLDWDTTGKQYYLLDTFRGIETKYLNDSEKEDGVEEKNKERIAASFYTTDPESVAANFSQWTHVRMIVGAIPETLDQIDTRAIAFLHLDMNCAEPEIAAIEYLWDRIVPGGIILLDDYAYFGYRNQKVAMDRFAVSKGIAIASLPTGQGLIVK